VQEKALLMAGLQSAVANGELWVAYQPRVDCKTGQVRSVEALLRWNHPTLGAIAPDRFVPLAEQTGMISAVGTWVLETACAQMRRWRDEGRDLEHVAVNLSVRQLLRPECADEVAAIVQRAGIQPRDLELEITESMAMHDPELAVASLNGLHALGVRLALDDFGTGYAALAYLKRLPLDDLKIDRAFVAGVPHVAEDAAIARAILALARSLGLNVIAEGVETAAQRDFLAAEGCREMQGHLFSVALPAPALRWP
jgi:EAL domain-containing protein (putative c-di-GMP-specific phosphodiesterase class I)